jgi:hypothetical protein
MGARLRRGGQPTRAIGIRNISLRGVTSQNGHCRSRGKREVSGEALLAIQMCYVKVVLLLINSSR